MMTLSCANDAAGQARTAIARTNLGSICKTRALLPRILAEDVAYVLIVLVTDVLQDFGILHQRRVPVHGKRLGVSSRIVDHDFVVQAGIIGAPVTLRDMELFGVRVSREIEPKLVV